VDKGLIPGAVVLIARNGKIAYLEAVGFRDRDKKIPMSTDAIFQIASMTKPFTSVATMMLVEEGKIQLNEPISLYLPEFKGVQVGVEKVNVGTGNPELILEAALREMTFKTYSGIPRGSPMELSANHSSSRDTMKQTFLIETRRWQSLCRNSQSFRLPINPGPYGITVCPLTCWGELSR
jgi:Beta-lactamase